MAKVWIVTQRQDIPDLWTYRGAVNVVPGEAISAPPRSKVVDVEPPPFSHSVKPAWDDTAQAWLLPRRVAVCNDAGEIVNFVAAYRDDDLPANVARAVDADVLPNAEDDTGAVGPAQVGDVIEASGRVRANRPKPPAADLSPAQFEYLLASTGLGDVWDAMSKATKATDRATYALLKANRSRSTYRLEATLAMVAQMAPLAATVAPDVDLSEATIRAAWEQAAGFE